MLFLQGLHEARLLKVRATCVRTKKVSEKAQYPGTKSADGWRSVLGRGKGAVEGNLVESSYQGPRLWGRLPSDSLHLVLD